MQMGWFKGITRTTPPEASHNAWWGLLTAWWNDHDLGRKPWTSLNVTTLTVSSLTTTGTTVLKGTTTNDNAAAGNIGEYIESVVAATNFPTTGTWGDLTSISLTAGDWDVTAAYNATANGATVTNSEIGISTTTGNSTTGLVQGSNRFAGPIPLASVRLAGVCVPSYRMSLSSTNTVYLKYEADFTVATPQAAGRLSARRVR